MAEKMRWSSAAVVFFFVLGMLSLPGVEVGATAAPAVLQSFRRGGHRDKPLWLRRTDTEQ